MTCFHPLKGYQSAIRSSNGGRQIVFNARKGFIDKPVNVPCRQCSGCRLEYSRQWAVRCMHEASMHDDNCFITLTYSPENLPFRGSLEKDVFPDFMKRLRDRTGRYATDDDVGIKAFYCGEYGDEFFRPHYHACIFNYDFPDKYYWRTSDNGDLLYRSPLLEDLWKFGNSEIGSVTFESAAYVARYQMKKLRLSKASNDAAIRAYEARYERMCPDTGEFYFLLPEFGQMSRRPGIGKGWFEAFLKDLYPDDFVLVNGQKAKIPRYYDEHFKKLCPDEFLLIKNKRVLDASRFEENNTHERLMVRKECLEARLKQLQRGVD